MVVVLLAETEGSVDEEVVVAVVAAMVVREGEEEMVVVEDLEVEVVAVDEDRFLLEAYEGKVAVAVGVARVRSASFLNGNVKQKSGLIPLKVKGNKLAQNCPPWRGHSPRTTKP
jgi:hypothetical protein